MEKIQLFYHDVYNRNLFSLKAFVGLTKFLFKKKSEKSIENSEPISYQMNIQLNEKLDLEKLTQRQKELIALMAEGFRNKEIAEKLYISENTVKFHIKNIYSALNLKNRKDFFEKLNYFDRPSFN